MPSPIIDSQVRPATAAPSAGQLPDEVVNAEDAGSIAFDPVINFSNLAAYHSPTSRPKPWRVHVSDTQIKVVAANGKCIISYSNPTVDTSTQTATELRDELLQTARLIAAAPEAMDAVVESHMVIGGLLNVIHEGVEPTDMSTAGNVPLAMSLCQTARDIESGLTDQMSVTLAMDIETSGQPPQIMGVSLRQTSPPSPATRVTAFEAFRAISRTLDGTDRIVTGTGTETGTGVAQNPLASRLGIVSQPVGNTVDMERVRYLMLSACTSLDRDSGHTLIERILYDIMPASASYRYGLYTLQRSIYNEDTRSFDTWEAASPTFHSEAEALHYLRERWNLVRHCPDVRYRIVEGYSGLVLHKTPMDLLVEDRYCVEVSTDTLDLYREMQQYLTEYGALAHYHDSVYSSNIVIDPWDASSRDAPSIFRVLYRSANGIEFNQVIISSDGSGTGAGSSDRKHRSELIDDDEEV